MTLTSTRPQAPLFVAVVGLMIAGALAGCGIRPGGSPGPASVGDLAGADLTGVDLAGSTAQVFSNSDLGDPRVLRGDLAGADLAQPPGGCEDGKLDGDETDVDCGGVGCAACAVGKICQIGVDCTSGVCIAGVCMAPSCTDGLKNGTETDVDCGGPSCMPCAVGKHCVSAYQCTSGVCDSGSCAAPSCTDAVKNATETDVDCGGSCSVCAIGKHCRTGTDCTSGSCAAGQCVAPSCTDGVQNGTETDVDCGGFSCAPCAPGKHCLSGFQCTSGLCSSGQCTEPTCADSVKNGDETDVDCGGTCRPCALGSGCLVAHDCVSAQCEGQMCTPVIVPLNLSGSITSTSSIDSGDGLVVYLTAPDWSVFKSTDGGGSFTYVFPGSSSFRAKQARVHVSRARPTDVVVYSYTTSMTSTYDPTLVVSHDGFTTSKQSQNGLWSWGNIAAFSMTDPSTVYFLGDNGGSRYSTNAADTSTAITPAPVLSPGGNSLWTPGAAEIDPTDSSKVWLAVAGATAPTVTRYDHVAQTVTDYSAQLRDAVGTLGGLEVYPRGTSYRMRFIGGTGAVATSDDLGATFQPVVGGGGLPPCGGWVNGLREIVSYADDHTRVASFCPNSNDVAVSSDGGATWTTVRSPTWTTVACAVNGVSLTSTKTLVSCNNAPPLAISL
jgi:hypothetical protein